MKPENQQLRRLLLLVGRTLVVLKIELFRICMWWVSDGSNKRISIGPCWAPYRGVNYSLRTSTYSFWERDLSQNTSAISTRLKYCIYQVMDLSFRNLSNFNVLYGKLLRRSLHYEFKVPNCSRAVVC